MCCREIPVAGSTPVPSAYKFFERNTMPVLVLDDQVWMLVNKEDQVIYCIGTSAQEVWEKVIDEEIMGTGITKADLKKQGFRAKKVAICEIKQ